MHLKVYRFVFIDFLTDEVVLEFVLHDKYLLQRGFVQRGKASLIQTDLDFSIFYYLNYTLFIVACTLSHVG